MCTSFIKTSDGHDYIAMNFDYQASDYMISTSKKGWLLGYIKTEKGKKLSFGIHQTGLFFNQLMVEPCEKGVYRRAKNVMHIDRLIDSMINHQLEMTDLEAYLENHEIVNVPNRSVHSMLCDGKGNVWIIEPGRGHRYSQLKSNEFRVMTNSVLTDSIPNTCWRYQKVSELLSKNDAMSVKEAFKILQAVKQDSQDWKTVFSMVYEPYQKVVYYCENQDFVHIKTYPF